jgi:hypothetical protein
VNNQQKRTDGPKLVELIEIGFTGTRRGMSYNQKKNFRIIFGALAQIYEIKLHHGDAIGADAEADAIGRLYNAKIIIHPPTDPKYRAFCCKRGDIQFPEKPYLVRDRDIVDPCDLLISTPMTVVEILRSGTWATIRYARKTDKPRINLEP